jgi:fructose-1,6-bisphosphatase/inositol monophosphatase family enzyme
VRGLAQHDPDIFERIGSYHLQSASMHPMLNIAVKAARRAGNVINRASRNLDAIAVREKAVNDFVSEVDREAEQAVIRTLREAYPSHSILAEESGASGESEYQWIIDPLDGTTNFAHGYPCFAVSIGLAEHGEPVAGVVFNPVSGEMFTAARGEGAYLNGKRIHVSPVEKLAHSLVATGFPPHSARTAPTSTTTGSSRCARTASGATAPPRSISARLPAAASTGSGSSA